MEEHEAVQPVADPSALSPTQRPVIGDVEGEGAGFTDDDVVLVERTRDHRRQWFGDGEGELGVECGVGVGVGLDEGGGVGGELLEDGDLKVVVDVGVGECGRKKEFLPDLHTPTHFSSAVLLESRI